ncbi:unnamed protein product [Symbiodinium sp. CCMP2592]|nr:unnamed protein product [Symbiodinium sp. CCMP2592]
MGQQAAKSLAPCVVRGKASDAEGDQQQLSMCLQRVERLLSDTETLERECDAHFRRAGLDAHGAMRRIELRRLLWTFAHSLGSTELTWEAIEAFAVTGTLEASVPVVTKDEFYRCVTKTVHLVAAELRRKLQEVEAKLHPAPRRPPPPPPQPEVRRDPHSTPKTPGRHSSPWAALAELSGSDAASPVSSRESQHSEPTEAENVEPSQVETKLAARSQEKLVSQDSIEQSFFRPAPDDEDPSTAREQRQPTHQEGSGINGMIVLVLSNEGNFDPHTLLVNGGVLALSSPVAEAGSGLLRMFAAGDGRSSFDLSLLEMIVRGAAIARTPAAAMIPGVVWKTPESTARTLVLFFSAGTALCLWFQESHHCTLCCEVLCDEARACGTASIDQQVDSEIAAASAASGSSFAATAAALPRPSTSNALSQPLPSKPKVSLPGCGPLPGNEGTSRASFAATARRSVIQRRSTDEYMLGDSSFMTVASAAPRDAHVEAGRGSTSTRKSVSSAAEARRKSVAELAESRKSLVEVMQMYGPDEEEAADAKVNRTSLSGWYTDEKDKPEDEAAAARERSLSSWYASEQERRVSVDPAKVVSLKEDGGGEVTVPSGVAHNLTEEATAAASEETATSTQGAAQ